MTQRRNRKAFELPRKYLKGQSWYRWNAMYDDVLRLPLPTGVKIVSFADDITLVVYGESLEVLGLARHKTEGVVVNNRKSEQQVPISVGDCTIEFKRSLMLLGL